MTEIQVRYEATFYKGKKQVIIAPKYTANHIICSSSEVSGGLGLVSSLETACSSQGGHDVEGTTRL